MGVLEFHSTLSLQYSKSRPLSSNVFFSLGDIFAHLLRTEFEFVQHPDNTPTSGVFSTVVGALQIFDICAEVSKLASRAEEKH